MTLSYLVGRRNYSNTPWTIERDLVLKRLWAEGYSATQIADQFNGADISRCAVIGRAHRLKLKPRRPRYPARKRFGSVPKPPAPPPRPRPPPPPPSAPAMRRLSLLELAPSQCHFPIGDPVMFFCAADAIGVYCDFHKQLTHKPDPRP